jgi:hypothetical protein
VVATPIPMPAGRRARKKDRTRGEIFRAAMDLFAYF